MFVLSWNEALSGITGSISLSSWIFLLLPQLLENYQAGSADGISLTFLFIWFVGDVTNLAGAIWAKLVPTVTALAVYFCIADAVLIGQCLYYNSKKKKVEDVAKGGDTEEAGEQTALLAAQGSPKLANGRKHSFNDITEDNLGLPGSRRRSSATSSSKLHRTRTTSSSGGDQLQAILETPSSPFTSTTRTYAKNTLSVFLILAVGTAGWAIAWQTGAWQPTPLGEDNGEHEATPLGAEILGYISAVCYLGARIPQIVKNQRERSCDGLSLLFFMLSLLGNLTYGAGILFHSLEREYIITNLPWLIGSLGTMAEDALIFVQFRMFGEKKSEEGSAVI
ncbi:hypothetical protein LTR62_004827 [Meristemomyces frigidus]|uniref:Vacuolar membrane PQ loop repeat protein n=1 Tax=Meristemomyces frigidus TaxID=1508187 RepID=A0AAN7TFM6_9PEZI|nr:hypothetical protein LTR62_004827 [Meristemomyces frigidus]